MGCRLWGRTELDTTEATWQQQVLGELIKYTHFLTSVCTTLMKDHPHHTDWSLGFSERQYLSGEE